MAFDRNDTHESVSPLCWLVALEMLVNNCKQIFKLIIWIVRILLNGKISMSSLLQADRGQQMTVHTTWWKGGGKSKQKAFTFTSQWVLCSTLANILHQYDLRLSPLYCCKKAETVTYPYCLRSDNRTGKKKNEWKHSLKLNLYKQSDERNMLIFRTVHREYVQAVYISEWHCFCC